MTREQWKWYWRQLRIIRRESWKATTDMMLFGNGCVKIGADVPDLIQHVPIEQICFDADGLVIT